MSSERSLVEMKFRAGVKILQIEIEGLRRVGFGKDRAVEVVPPGEKPQFYGVYARAQRDGEPALAEHLRDYWDHGMARREAWEMARKLEVQMDDRTIPRHLKMRGPSSEEVARTERSFRAASVTLFGGVDGAKERGFLPKSGAKDFEAARDNYLASMAELRIAAAKAQPNLDAEIGAVERAFAAYEKARKAELDRIPAGRLSDKEHGR